LPETGLQELMRAAMVMKSSDHIDQCRMYIMAGWLLERTGIKMQVNVGRLKVSLTAHSQRFGKQIPFCILLHTTCFIVVLCLAYSSSLQLEVICSSETLADFYWTAWCYITEDRTL
jgi:hypothetical protein